MKDNQEKKKSGWEAPESDLFRRARIACGYAEARYYSVMALQGKEPTLQCVGADEAPGKSASFFFLSPDQQMMAKSCTPEDWDTLLRLLPNYVEYVEAARNTASEAQRPEGSTLRGFAQTLLPRYLGMYALRVGEGGPAILVLVMANVFAGTMQIQRRYDLKGSTHGRKASVKEVKKKSPTFKDVDWMHQAEPLRVDHVTRATVLATLASDVDFLSRHGLMDYSMLVGVHDCVPKDRVHEAMHVVTLSDDRRCCYIGIVDVLTPYGRRKQLETFLCGKVLCGRDISCQHPKKYASRFLEFMSDWFVSHDCSQ